MHRFALPLPRSIASGERTPLPTSNPMVVFVHYSPPPKKKNAGPMTECFLRACIRTGIRNYITAVCTSSLVAADEHFHRKESGYQLEETARSSQENTVRFRMILEYHRTVTGMPPFVVAMEQGRYGL